jgi:hypothetical protein
MSSSNSTVDARAPISAVVHDVAFIASHPELFPDDDELEHELLEADRTAQAVRDVLEFVEDNPYATEDFDMSMDECSDEGMTILDFLMCCG